MNYNMQGMNKSVSELFAMLKVAESNIQKDHQVLMVNKTTSFKKGKGKKGYFMKRQISCCSSEETQGSTQTRD